MAHHAVTIYVDAQGVDVNPNCLQVNPGDTVHWINVSDVDVKLTPKQGWDPTGWTGGRNLTTTAPVTQVLFDGTAATVAGIGKGTAPTECFGKQGGKNIGVFHYSVVVGKIVFDPTVIIIDP